MNILSVIIARGQSKGIPRKNLADLGGIPLIGHMISHARQCGIESDVVVSTEDDEIARVAAAFGAEVPFRRPAELAEDSVQSLPVVQHAVRSMEEIKGRLYDLVVYLQPTAPLCRPSDISACIRKLSADERAQSVVTIVEVDTHPFRMKRLVDGERVINFIDQGFEDMRPRQVLPKVYRRSGAVYASRRSVVMEANTLVGDPCLGILVPRDTSIDIDSPIDLEMARLIVSRRTSGPHL